MIQPFDMPMQAPGSNAQKCDRLVDNVAILGGLGEVGTLLARSLAASGSAVWQVDRRLPPDGAAAGRLLRADVTDPDAALRRAIAAADCVIVCLPEGVALAAASRILGAMGKGALWVDTLSVKSGICALLERAPDVEVLSINPMFAP